MGVRGARLVLPRPGAHRDPRTLLTAVARHGVTVIHFVPSMLGPFLDLLTQAPDLRRQADPLRLVFASGEELPARRVDQFHRLFRLPSGADPAAGARLVNLYGPTEATVDVTHHECHPDPDRPTRRVPIGRPIDNVRLYVLGRDDQPQPVGVPGELCVAGVAVARGYLGRAGAGEAGTDGTAPAAARFVTDPVRGAGRMYRTGDLARWLADGNLDYLGRLDGQVKIRGNRVEPGEVQQVLAGYPGIRDAAVVARTSPVGTSTWSATTWRRRIWIRYGSAATCCATCRTSWCPRSSTGWTGCPSPRTASSTWRRCPPPWHRRRRGRSRSPATRWSARSPRSGHGC
ncbi:hypothetical protein GCM10029963_03560 [Micromonospora andamanensis]